ncbi:MAG: hypothetical protein HQ567_31265 [Candidatus Nealsonbacteria bacterium]|nr:hypothetical protein [Candidatus Nealsonbacteria bacterium]
MKTEDADQDLRLTVVEISPRFDGKSYRGRFTFKNRTKEEIRLPCCEGAANGIVRANQVEVETLEGDRWKPVTIYRDAIPTTATVRPGSSVEIVVRLPFREKMGTPLTARMRLGELMSDSFVLDWEKDRKDEKFKLARIQHIDRLRRLLEKAGFKKEFLRDDDFWRKFMESVQKRVGTTDHFEPFRAKVVPLPNIDIGDVVKYHHWSDDVSNYENRYHLGVRLNPSRLGRDWAQNPRFTKVQVVMISGRMRVNLGDQYVDDDKLGFGLNLDYYPERRDSLPTRKNLEVLGKELLAEIRTHLSGN